MTVALADHPEGVILPVKAQPGARTSGIRGEHGGMLKISVTQAAERGKANQALLQTVSQGLGLVRSQVELVGGTSSPQKRFLIRGISREELERRIAAALTAR